MINNELKANINIKEGNIWMPQRIVFTVLCLGLKVIVRFRENYVARSKQYFNFIDC